MAFDGETKSNCSHVASHVDVALSHVDVALSRQEMVEWLATELTDELTCENLKERTVLMRLNALRRYIGLCISGTGKLSLSQVFSNADMMRSFLLAEPISSRSHSISALLKVNSILQQQAGRQCPNYDKLVHEIPLFLAKARTTAVRVYRKALVASKDVKARLAIECAKLHQAGSPYKLLQSCIRDQVPRFYLLGRAALSYKYEVRLHAQAGDAAALLSELKRPTFCSQYEPPLLEEPLSDDEADEAGDLLRLTKYPSVWLNEATAILFLAIQCCVKPERGSCVPPLYLPAFFLQALFFSFPLPFQRNLFWQ
jgi:hypothetical protein